MVFHPLLRISSYSSYDHDKLETAETMRIERRIYFEAKDREIAPEKLAEIAHGYGAFLTVDMAHIAGLVAGGMHQSPVPDADVVTTTTQKTLRGPRGGLILTNNGIPVRYITALYTSVLKSPVIVLSHSERKQFDELIGNFRKISQYRGGTSARLLSPPT